MVEDFGAMLFFKFVSVDTERAERRSHGKAVGARIRNVRESLLVVTEDDSAGQVATFLKLSSKLFFNCCCLPWCERRLWSRSRFGHVAGRVQVRLAVGALAKRDLLGAFQLVEEIFVAVIHVVNLNDF